MRGREREKYLYLLRSILGLRGGESERVSTVPHVSESAPFRGRSAADFGPIFGRGDGPFMIGLEAPTGSQYSVFAKCRGLSTPKDTEVCLGQSRTELRPKKNGIVGAPPNGGLGDGGHAPPVPTLANQAPPKPTLKRTQADGQAELDLTTHNRFKGEGRDFDMKRTRGTPPEA